MPTWDVQMKTNLQLSPRRPQYPKYDPKTFSTFSSLLDNIKADQRQETLLLKKIVAEAIHNLQYISDPFCQIPVFTSSSLQFPTNLSSSQLLDLVDRFTSFIYLFISSYLSLFILSFSQLFCVLHITCIFTTFFWPE